MEEITRLAGALVSAIKAHDMEALVFHPDAPLETPAVVLFCGRHVKDEAAYFAQKLAPHVFEFVVLFIERVHIDVNHLQEAAWQKLHGHGYERSQTACCVLQVWSALIARQGLHLKAFAKVGFAQVILVSRRSRT